MFMNVFGTWGENKKERKNSNFPYSVFCIYFRNEGNFEEKAINTNVPSHFLLLHFLCLVIMFFLLFFKIKQGKVKLSQLPFPFFVKNQTKASSTSCLQVLLHCSSFTFSSFLFPQFPNTVLVAGQICDFILWSSISCGPNLYMVKFCKVISGTEPEKPKVHDLCSFERNDCGWWVCNLGVCKHQSAFNGGHQRHWNCNGSVPTSSYMGKKTT